MSSSLLAFDLKGRNATSERERNARGFVQPEFNHGEGAVGLVVREESESSSSRQSFAERDRSHFWVSFFALV